MDGTVRLLQCKFLFCLFLSLLLAHSLARLASLIHFARKSSHAEESLSLSFTFRIPFTEWILNEVFTTYSISFVGWWWWWCGGGWCGSMDGNLKKEEILCLSQSIHSNGIGGSLSLTLLFPTNWCELIFILSRGDYRKFHSSSSFILWFLLCDWI